MPGAGRELMFSELFNELQKNNLPDPAKLRQRYDFALIKKLAVIKLPPAFRMQDPKINPQADHLLWAALLLKDRERIDTALSVLALELTEATPGNKKKDRGKTAEQIRKLVNGLLEQIPDASCRRRFAGELAKVIPEWLSSSVEESQ